MVLLSYLVPCRMMETPKGLILPLCFLRLKGLPSLSPVMSQVVALDRPAHPVVVADEGVQGHVGEDVVKTGGVLGDAPMDVGHRPFAVAGELPGQIHHIRFRYIRQLGPLGELAGADGFPENLEHALHLDALDFGVHQQVALHRVGLAVGVEGLGRAAGINQEGVKFPVAVAFLLGPLFLGEAQVRTPQISAPRCRPD